MERSKRFALIWTPNLKVVMLFGRFLILPTYVARLTRTIAKLRYRLLPSAYGVTYYSCDDLHWRGQLSFFAWNGWHADRVLESLEGIGDGGNSSYRISFSALIQDRLRSLRGAL